MKALKTLSTCIGASALLLAVAHTAPAQQAISLNFASDVGAFESPPTTATAVGANTAGVVPVGNWNDIPLAQQTTLALKDSLGATVSGLTLSTAQTFVFSPSAYDSWATNNNFTSAGDNAMMRGHIYHPVGNGPVDLTFNGTIPYTNFDVYVYYHGGSVAQTTRFSILDGSGASLGLSQLGKEVTGGAVQSSFVQSDGTGGNAANYVKFSNLTSASVPTNFRVRVGEGAYPLINGVQIVNTASANPPTQLAYAVVPGIGAVGVPFTVTVGARDADGLSAVVTSDTTITLSVASGSGSLSGGTTTGIILKDTSGILIPGVVYDTADTMTLTATATSGMTGLTPVTSGDIVFALPPSKLVYTSVPATGAPGIPFSVTVQAQDADGIPRNVPSATTITLSKASGGGTLSGTLAGTIPGGANSVTIATPVYSAQDTMTLTATATSGMTGLTPATSGDIVFSKLVKTDLTTDPNNPIIKWTSSDGTTATGAWTVPAGVSSVSVIIVGGGGGGGQECGGGGGGGGVIYNTSFAVTAGSPLTVTVGGGGARGYNGNNPIPLPGGNGSNSVFDTLNAIGGGGGAASSLGTPGSDGGSGGGGAGYYDLTLHNTQSTAGGSGSQGNAGGYGYYVNPGAKGGGGGGAGGAGTDAFSGGNGGGGVLCPIDGNYYGGGGGGGSYQVAAGTGGSGGGANGLEGITAWSASGAPNTGGGGGGGSAGNGRGGAGGSGIVIVTYSTAPPVVTTPFEDWVGNPSPPGYGLTGDNATVTTPKWMQTPTATTRTT